MAGELTRLIMQDTDEESLSDLFTELTAGSDSQAETEDAPRR